VVFYELNACLVSSTSVNVSRKFGVQLWKTQWLLSIVRAVHGIASSHITHSRPHRGTLPPWHQFRGTCGVQSYQLGDCSEGKENTVVKAMHKQLSNLQRHQSILFGT
jgi:hypothetical protein